jgi:hypothetical protein
MKKRIILVIILLILVTTGCDKLKNAAKKVEGQVEQVVKKVPLMEMDNFKDIVIDKIKSINIIRYTEGGADDKEIIDKEEIKSIYNSLSKIKVGKETDRACEDNTKVYVFNMIDGKKIKVEIECDWLVIGNKRYEIE